MTTSALPLDQSRANTFALQRWFADNGLGQRAVRGVVLLMPAQPTSLELNPRWTDPSFAVLLGDTDAHVRDYFTVMTPDARESWTANDIATAFRAVGLTAQLPAPAELLAEGFLGPVDPSLWPERRLGHRVRRRGRANWAAAAVEAPTGRTVRGGAVRRRQRHPIGSRTARGCCTCRCMAKVRFRPLPCSGSSWHWACSSSFIWLVWFSVAVLMQIESVLTARAVPITYR